MSVPEGKNPTLGSLAPWLRFAPTVPELRIRPLNDRPIIPQRPVLYWMSAQQRTCWNFAVDRAVEICRQNNAGLLIVTSPGPYQPRTTRHLAFWLDGLKGLDIPHQKNGGASVWAVCPPDFDKFIAALTTLSRWCGAFLVDDFPFDEYRRLLQRLARSAVCRVEAIDSCGLVPLAVPGRAFLTARSFREFVAKILPTWLRELPHPRPLSDRLLGLPPVSLENPLPREETVDLTSPRDCLKSPWVDRSVPPIREPGGREAARARWKHFIEEKLSAYDRDRNHPDAAATSGLSGYLHYGMISPFEMVVDLLEAAVSTGWNPQTLERTVPEKSWWGLPPGWATFLDQLLVWREIGFNFCSYRKEYKTWDSLPEWARRTLTRHRRDPRPALYHQDTLEEADTHDAVWNAAQRELRETGRIHNYMRMLWGKKIIEWTRTPEEALEITVTINDRYAIDGSDPNSYSGIGWVFGRYDRPWGPERPIFGTVRFMSTTSAQRKLRLKRYLEKFGPDSEAASTG